jgi:hypothetical protein
MNVSEMDGDLIRWTESFLKERRVEMMIAGNGMERHPVGAVVAQGLLVSPMVCAIYSSGLIESVEVYLSEAEGQSCVEDLGWVATGSDVNHVVSRLERFAAKRILWASRCVLQVHTAKTEVALFTRRCGHRKHIWAKPTAKIRVGS